MSHVGALEQHLVSISNHNQSVSEQVILSSLSSQIWKYSGGRDRFSFIKKTFRFRGRRREVIEAVTDRELGCFKDQPQSLKL